MPRKRIYADDAARVAAYRARHELIPFTVDLPKDVIDGMNEFMRFKNITKSALVTKLVRSQLLRKR